jgi:Protein of unknown function (DUF4242)
MPRYLVEQEFPDGLAFPASGANTQTYRAVVENNADVGVTWLHSYVTSDRKQVFCIYDAPSPEAIRRAAHHNNLPIKQIHEVRVLDPYSYN